MSHGGRHSTEGVGKEGEDQALDGAEQREQQEGGGFLDAAVHRRRDREGTEEGKQKAKETHNDKARKVEFIISPEKSEPIDLREEQMERVQKFIRGC